MGAARLSVPLARALLVTLPQNRKRSVVLLFEEDSWLVSWTAPRSSLRGAEGSLSPQVSGCH